MFPTHSHWKFRMHRKHIKVKRLKIMRWLEVQPSNSECLKATVRAK